MKLALRVSAVSLLVLLVSPTTVTVLSGAPTTSTCSSQPNFSSDQTLLAGANGPEAWPVMFIENVGQFDKQVRFQVRGGIGTLWLADDGLWVTLLERRESGGRSPEIEEANNESRMSEVQSRTSGVNLKLTFPNANPDSRIEPFNRLDTKVSYFMGNAPEKWRTDVPVWAGVRYVDLYPGVDLELMGKAGHWTWRLVFRNAQYPRSNVKLRVAGADTWIRGSDHLRLATSVGGTPSPY